MYNKAYYISPRDSNADALVSIETSSASSRPSLPLRVRQFSKLNLNLYKVRTINGLCMCKLTFASYVQVGGYKIG